MMTTATSEATIPNPNLQPFEALIGSWSLVGSHP